MARLRYALYDHPDVACEQTFTIHLYDGDVEVVNGIAEVSDPLTIDTLIVHEGFVLVEEQDEEIQEEAEAGADSPEVAQAEAPKARRSRRKRASAS